jgi:putative transcriptional regulator
LGDSSFRQTVVLLLQHTGEGALGLVVNRPVPAKELPFPVYAGGPCTSEGLLMLHGHREWIDEDEVKERQIAPGIFLGDASCLTRVKDAPESESLRYRLFSGYSGWGPDQLEGERASGAWAVVPATAEILFSTPADELWERLVPPSIPQPSVN